ncbi:MAG: DUF1553 domain-containing protein [Planctomycetes bacterium]|nr:DUF1553 domain-containing protein [Planctomycetota bacterium]
MRRTHFALVAACCLAPSLAFGAAIEKSSDVPAKVLPPASIRFESPDVKEVPSLQRHVLPLMGRLGCSGRACHGSFQGQGGFRLSLFGYDFKTDFEAIVKSETPRVDVKKPAESMILAKTSSDVEDEHGGGKRMEKNSWQYRLISKWIEAGAPAVDEAKDPTFVKMEVRPTEIEYVKPGETTQLHVVAHWSDGTIEDVTPLCRFQTNDDAVAKVDVNGVITCVGKGDTHVVAFYDNGVVPVAVMLPVSDQVGPKYPNIPAKTKVDELVLTKLKKIGVVASDVCTDEEFLRRASLDVTGVLPTADEVRAFLADKSPNKRAAKVDELLSRPAYAAWWTTKLSDILGNSENQLRNSAPAKAGTHWYEWLHRRVADNVHYDDIVEGIVLAVSRTSPDQDYLEYCQEMTSYVRDDKPADFTARETMPYYWMRRNMRTSNEKALSFSYAFLGVRLQCAECHKHPFDQWSQYDFQHFTAFFDRITSGTGDREIAKELIAKAGVETDPKKVGGAKIRADLDRVARSGGVVPFSELYVRAPKAAPKGKKDKSKVAAAGRVLTPKVLGGDEIVDQNYDDPREPLMDWLRQKDNPYFARAFVNRVWAHYFNVGIVEPADDMNLANAPSNRELLDYLAAQFVEHDYDIKWLMREIVNSDTYQRSWLTNSTNEFDLRNFSHAVPRRLPAEVVYDAVVSATAGQSELARRAQDPVTNCAIGMSLSYTNRNNINNYALTVFGKPKRETPCDCERSNEPSLLQTVYLRNDQEMFRMIERPNGWLDAVTADLPGTQKKSSDPAAELRNKERELARMKERLKEETAKAKKNKGKVTANEAQRLLAMKDRAKEKMAELEAEIAALQSAGDQGKQAKPQSTAELINEAYLRTFTRYPTKDELATAEEYMKTAENPATGIRDLVWALLNTKEFVVNH